MARAEKSKGYKFGGTLTLTSIEWRRELGANQGRLMALEFEPQRRRLGHLSIRASMLLSSQDQVKPQIHTSMT